MRITAAVRDRSFTLELAAGDAADVLPWMHAALAALVLADQPASVQPEASQAAPRAARRFLADSSLRALKEPTLDAVLAPGKMIHVGVVTRLCDLPGSCQDEFTVLALASVMDPPIDLRLTDVGILATLRFGGVEYPVTVPWCALASICGPSGALHAWDGRQFVAQGGSLKPEKPALSLVPPSDPGTTPPTAS